jgi:hypothetical protein
MTAPIDAMAEVMGRWVRIHSRVGAGRPGPAVPGEVEVGPPCAEPGHDREEGDGEREGGDRRVGESIDDTGHGFAEHDDDQQAESLGQGISDGERGGLDRRSSGDHGREPGQVGGADQAPDRHTTFSRQEGAPDQRSRAQRGPGHECAAGAAVLESVTAPGEKPDQSQCREQHTSGDRERSSAGAARLGDEGAERDEHQDLQQQYAPAASIVAAVQFVMERAVEPGDPHESENRGELAQSLQGEVSGQVVAGAGDQHDHDEVIEQFQRADDALARLVPMGPRRLPQLAAQPRPVPAMWCHSDEYAVGLVLIVVRGPGTRSAAHRHLTAQYEQFAVSRLRRGRAE